MEFDVETVNFDKTDLLEIAGMNAHVGWTVKGLNCESSVTSLTQRLYKLPFSPKKPKSKRKTTLESKSRVQLHRNTGKRGKGVIVTATGGTKPGKVSGMTPKQLFE